jgi:hypothetical protein
VNSTNGTSADLGAKANNLVAEQFVVREYLPLGPAYLADSPDDGFTAARGVLR